MTCARKKTIDPNEFETQKGCPKRKERKRIYTYKTTLLKLTNINTLVQIISAGAALSLTITLYTHRYTSNFFLPVKETNRDCFLNFGIICAKETEALQKTQTK